MAQAGPRGRGSGFAVGRGDLSKEQAGTGCKEVWGWGCAHAGTCVQPLASLGLDFLA